VNRSVPGRLTPWWEPVHAATGTDDRSAAAARRLPFQAVGGYGVERSDRDGCAVVAVHGEVDVLGAPRLREALIAAAAEGHRRVVVDLSRTDFLDSTGLSALVTGLKRVRAHGGEMRVVCTSARVCKVFEITSLDRALRLYRTVDEACAGP
jgi:anti-sigma B factor antagonist